MSLVQTFPPGVQTVILLIEDDDSIRSAIREVLQIKGYSILEVIDVVSALEKLGDGNAEFVIADYDNNQWIDPKQAIQMMCVAAPTVNFIVLTGKDDDLIELKKVEQIEVISKPFQPEDLLDMISVKLCAEERQTEGEAQGN